MINTNPHNIKRFNLLSDRAFRLHIIASAILGEARYDEVSTTEIKLLATEHHMRFSDTYPPVKELQEAGFWASPPGRPNVIVVVDPFPGFVSDVALRVRRHRKRKETTALH